MSTPPDQWYVRGAGDRPSGPFSTDRLLDRLWRGQVDETTPCWREGMADWQPMGQVEPFAAVVRGEATPPQALAGMRLAYPRADRNALVSAIAVGVPCGVVAVALFGSIVLSLMMLPALARAREEARRIRCRNNLNQMAKGMATYLTELGDNRFYPCPLGRGARADNYNGAEWLASLYWTSVVPDPGVFLCPSTSDTNHNGRDLGAERADRWRFGPHTVSYAGMHYYSMTEAGGTRVARAIPDMFPPNMPMGSDDTQDPINHGEEHNGGMSVLFFDSHVEFKTNREIDLRRGVGKEGGLLWQLRN
ncbi:MAG: DUF4339 domain-containing protein [Candidatus Brocadiia bacterium]